MSTGMQAPGWQKLDIKPSQIMILSGEVDIPAQVVDALKADLGSAISKIQIERDDAVGNRTGKTVAGLFTVKVDYFSSTVKGSGELSDTHLGDMSVDKARLAQITGGKGKPMVTLAATKGVQLQRKIVKALIEKNQFSEALDFVAELETKGQSLDVVDRLKMSIMCEFMDYTPEEVMALDQETLKAEFIERIFIPRSMHQADANNDAVEVRLFNIANNIDFRYMPEEGGDVDVEDANQYHGNREFFNIMKEAGVGGQIMMAMEKAPKYSKGGVSVQEYQPVGLEDWPTERSINITGNAYFRGKVEEMLNVITQTDVGKLLLLELAAYGEDPEIIPPSATKGNRVGDDGSFFYSNSAGGNACSIDPDNWVSGPDDSQSHKLEEPWAFRDPVIALFHELVHVSVALPNV
ncbi:MAG: hypothetical protein ACI9BD_001593 [Candidatus Marinamargulisbacteria bacterium]|jgi:hypothetical protein